MGASQSLRKRLNRPEREAAGQGREVVCDRKERLGWDTDRGTGGEGTGPGEHRLPGKWADADPVTKQPQRHSPAERP